MEFSWTTFIFELINFLVLVWILKRLFYRPILELIAKRKKTIEDTVRHAEELREQAKQFEQKYQSRLEEWEKEKESWRKKFEKELAEEKEKRQQALEESLKKTQEKFEAQQKKLFLEQSRKNEQKALELAGRFGTRLFRRFASYELEHKICNLFFEDLSKLSLEKIKQVQKALDHESDQSLMVETAFPLDDNQKQEMKSKLQKTLGLSSQIQFNQNPELLAGIALSAGSFLLEANLKSELNFFTQEFGYGS